MKRAPELTPLSREHHEALVLARRACEPARPGAEPAALRDQVLQRWEAFFEVHFQLEETVLLPALSRAGASEDAAVAREQHQRLRRLVRDLGAMGPSVLPEWGEAMRDHVKWEERHLFPLAERLLDLAALEGLLAARH